MAAPSSTSCTPTTRTRPKPNSRSNSSSRASLPPLGPLTSPRLGSPAGARDPPECPKNDNWPGRPGDRRTSGLIELSIPRRGSAVDDVLRSLEGLAWGGTDCALPMVWAQKNRVDVDTFVIYTDNETWAGPVHPAQALRSYREAGFRPSWSWLE